jgi:hypothetical protein
VAAIPNDFPTASFRPEISQQSYDNSAVPAKQNSECVFALPSGRGLRRDCLDTSSLRLPFLYDDPGLKLT